MINKGSVVRLIDPAPCDELIRNFLGVVERVSERFNKEGEQLCVIRFVNPILSFHGTIVTYKKRLLEVL